MNSHQPGSLILISGRVFTDLHQAAGSQSHGGGADGSNAVSLFIIGNGRQRLRCGIAKIIARGTVKMYVDQSGNDIASACVDDRA